MELVLPYVSSKAKFLNLLKVTHVLRILKFKLFQFSFATNINEILQPDGSLERLLRESEILRQAFGHLFDYVILNNDIDDTIRQLELVVEKLNACPQWVPVSWVY